MKKRQAKRVLSRDEVIREADEIITEDNSGKDHELIFSDNIVPLTSNKTDLVRFDPLQKYLNEIRHIKTMSKEEEHETAVQYLKTGDRSLALKLVVSNLRLVVMIAREHQRNVQNILDLVQEGNIGLLEAVEKYDPYRGIRFPSYAVFWIRAYILRFLINNIRLVKLGTTQAQRKLFFNLVKEKDKLEKEGFVPESKLLASRLGVKESEVIEMEQRLRLPDLSVDAPINRSDEDNNTMHGILTDDSKSIETTVMDAEFAEAIKSAVFDYMDSADEKEKAIIEQRLLTDDPNTLQEIADGFGISRERIRQIENRLKDRLKSILSKKLELNDKGEPNV